jgi:peroxiredoxin
VPDWVFWVLLAVLGLGVLPLWLLLYQLLRQHGRLLLRIEALEDIRSQPVSASLTPGPTTVGLPIATAVHPFRLPDLNGNVVGIEDFRGRRVLLVNWNPGCGFCARIAPELASLQTLLRKRSTELVLVSNGDRESNARLAEESGLTCPILLRGNSHAVEAFAGLGTPVAYSLDENGRTDRPLALGAIAVPALARELAGRKPLSTERPLSESRIERDGLKAGTRAPSFRLPDLGGRMLSLDDYRGRRLLLVFSDPNCGPCEAVGADLADFYRGDDRDGLEVVMVSRGDLEENRRAAKRKGLEFPVVLQPGWKVSRDYGIFSTPVAFLVDEQGVIARNVAKGRHEVMSLARAAARREVTAAKH